MESPHTDELRHQTPIAGKSGKAISKTIFGAEQTTPFGLLVKAHQSKEKLNEKLKKVGVMNVCQIPMQPSAYQANVQKKHTLLLNNLDKLRSQLTPGDYRNPMLNEIRNWIVEGLCTELAKLLHERIVFIPCGKFANHYLERAGIRSTWTIVDGVPHPARNQWQKAGDSLKDRLQNVIG